MIKETNNEAQMVFVSKGDVSIEIKSQRCIESDIDEMCSMFSDALLGLGYRFKEGWTIEYAPEEK